LKAYSKSLDNDEKKRQKQLQREEKRKKWQQKFQEEDFIGYDEDGYQDYLETPVGDNYWQESRTQYDDLYRSPYGHSYDTRDTKGTQPLQYSGDEFGAQKKLSFEKNSQQEVNWQQKGQSKREYRGQPEQWSGSSYDGSYDTRRADGLQQLQHENGKTIAKQKMDREQKNDSGLRSKLGGLFGGKRK
jgi:hypothetical protein